MTHNILNEIHAERQRQHELHGDQTHLPMGTGEPGSDRTRTMARLSCDGATNHGRLTFRHILWEEVAEAFAETDPAKLRAELVQVAAVCVQMVEAIDRREATDD